MASSSSEFKQEQFISAISLEPVVFQSPLVDGNKQLATQAVELEKLKEQLAELQKNLTAKTAEADELRLALSKPPMRENNKQSDSKEPMQQEGIRSSAATPLKYGVAQQLADAKNALKRELGEAKLNKHLILLQTRRAQNQRAVSFETIKRALADNKKQHNEQLTASKEKLLQYVNGLSLAKPGSMGELSKALASLEKQELDYKTRREQLIYGAAYTDLKFRHLVASPLAQEDAKADVIKKKEKLRNAIQAEQEELTRLLQANEQEITRFFPVAKPSPTTPIPAPEVKKAYGADLLAAILTADVEKARSLIDMEGVSLKEFVLHDALFQISREQKSTEKTKLIEIAKLIMAATPREQINRQDEAHGGDTALHFAALANEPSLVRELLTTYHATPSLVLRNKAGKTPADIFQALNVNDTQMEALLGIPAHKVADSKMPVEGAIAHNRAPTDEESKSMRIAVNTVNLPMVLKLLEGTNGDFQADWTIESVGGGGLRLRRTHILSYIIARMGKQQPGEPEKDMRRNLRLIAIHIIKTMSPELINQLDPLSHDTALHWACNRGDTVIVKLLYERGANPWLVNTSGKRPADESSPPGIFHYLLDAPRPSKSSSSSVASNPHAIYAQVAHKRAPYPEENQQMIKAVKLADIATVQSLLNKTNGDFMAPLSPHPFSFAGKKVTHILLHALSAMHIFDSQDAAYARLYEIAMSIIKVMPSERINQQDPFSLDTASHWACRLNERAMAESLKSRGADFSMINKHGKTPPFEASSPKEFADLLSLSSSSQSSPSSVVPGSPR